MKFGKLLILIFVLLISCDDEEATPIIRGYMSAEISGEYNFNFFTDQILVNLTQDSTIRSIYASGNFKSNDTLFFLTASINNDTLLIGDTFQVQKTGSPRRIFESLNYGIEQDSIFFTDSSMVIPFEFDALFGTFSNGSISYDTVYVRNGIINYLR